MKGIIMIGHGSRSREAQAQFMGLVEAVRKSSGNMVEGAFMELAQPGFFETVNKLAAAGINDITVYPVFLFTGIHLKEDIPEMIEKASEQHGEITFRLLQPVGIKEEFAKLIIKDIKEL